VPELPSAPWQAAQTAVKEASPLAKSAFLGEAAGSLAMDTPKHKDKETVAINVENNFMTFRILS
jgi:hypothetical protein